MSKKIIIFFRHGQTEWNVEGRIQGHLDIPLNQKGIKQAEQLAEHIKSKDLEIILSSDLLRAHETAIIVGRYCNIQVETATALREIYAGKAEGTYKIDLNETFCKYFNNIDPKYDHIGFEKGETKKEAKKRISLWLKSYLESTQYTRIGICSHNQILKLLLVDFGYTPDDMGNCELIEIEL